MGIGAGLTAAAVAIGTAVSSAGAAIAAISLTTAFEITAAVGAAVSVVGMVTKDKTLSMVGMAIGLVGGIGGLASSAGIFGAEAASGASLFGAAPAASTADAVAGTAAETGATFADSLVPATSGTIGGAIDAGTFGSSAVDAASAGTVNFVADGLPQGQDSLTTLSAIGEKAPSVTDSLGATAPTGLEPSALTNTSTSATTAGSADLPLPPDAPPGTLDANGIATVTGKPAAAWQYSGQATPGVNAADGTSTISGGGSFGDILKFVNDNKTLVSGVATVGGKLLEGMTSSLTPAQVAALNAQANANNAAADLTNQQRTNLAMPKAVASSTPVTGTPGPLIPPSGAPGGPGIINQPRLAPVTGAVA